MIVSLVRTVYFLRLKAENTVVTQKKMFEKYAADNKEEG